MIRAVMFDMGGTLEDIYSDEASYKATAQALYDILKSHDIACPYSVDELWEKIYANHKVYKDYAAKTNRELKPEEIWADYCFKGLDVDREKIVECSEEIAHMWEVTYYHRSLRPRVKEMLDGLKYDLGLKLSVISNTASLFQVFSTLEEYGIRDYFDDVTLSSVTGYRKPHPYVFEVALRQTQLKPEECCYVGDTISRDVVGPKKKGYAETFHIYSFLTASRDVDSYEFKPEHKIDDIYDVYTILKTELGK